ncbi:MAG: outer membrane beta-barrel protein [Betaproteobacteria bacterium]|nr:outer membrane beta-barrel protein [Betaproteobacteria bacterium]
MQAKTQILALALAGATALGANGAMAADAPSTFAGNWYLGAGLGSARAKVEDSTVTSVLAGTGATATATSRSENSIEGKLFLGYQFNRFIAVEGGYFRLGDFKFDTTTAPAGTLHGEMKNRMGWNLDAVGSIPIVAEKFMLLGRVGVQSSKTTDLFAGTGAAGTLANPTPSRNLVSYKYGLGAEFDFTKNIGVRAEWERYRVSDGFTGKMNVDAITASLLYRF